MPQRKRPKSLEAASLESIGENIFLATLSLATQNILHQYLLEQLGDASFESKYSRYELEEILSELELNKLCLSASNKWKVYNQNKSSFRRRAMQIVENNVLQLQKFFFVETAHYFHSHIAIECMVIDKQLD